MALTTNSNGGGDLTGGTGGTSSSSGSMDTLAWIKFINDVAQSRKQGSFQNVPMSPEQKQLYDFSFDRIKNLPDPTKDLYPLAMQHATTNPQPFDIDAAKAGKVAYRSPTFSAHGLAGVLTGKTPADQFPARVAAGQASPDGFGAPKGGGVANGFAGNILRDTSPSVEGMIPQPSMPETDFRRNVGIPGNIQSQDPTAGGAALPSYPGGQMQPGSGAGFAAAVQGFTSFLQSQGVQDAAKIAAGFLSGGLTGAAATAAKLLWDRFSGGSNPPPPSAPTTPGTGATGAPGPQPPPLP